LRIAPMCAATHTSRGTCGYIRQMDLPPGPRLPRTAQTVAWWTRTVPFMERCRARYGKRFTVRLLQAPPFVYHADPDPTREIFTAPPEVPTPARGRSCSSPWWARTR